MAEHGACQQQVEKGLVSVTPPLPPVVDWRKDLPYVDVALCDAINNYNRQQTDAARAQGLHSLLASLIGGFVVFPRKSDIVAISACAKDVYRPLDTQRMRALACRAEMQQRLFLHFEMRTNIK